MFIDSHAHIYGEEFDNDRKEVLEKCVEVGVKKIYMPNVDAASIDPMLEAEEKYPGLCIPMMGLHPTYVKKGFEQQLYIMEDWLKKRKFAAVGEVGTDLYWDTSTFDMQVEALKVQIGFAKQYSLPLVIHCRNSFKETIDIIREQKDATLTGVFHCFTGTVDEAKQAIELGFYLGIGGVATFKNGGLDKVLPHIDLKHLMLETDSPYLAPVPFRGKRNSPEYIPSIAEKLAVIKNVALSQVEEITTENALNLFKL